jgi:metallo-beta-lactamase family protein
MIRLAFHGAAETVTGSKYLLECEGSRLLIDCGLFQGLKELRLKNWQPLPFEPAAVDAAVITHAHIDHLGYFPRFVKGGFRGRAWCTPATEDLAEIMLLDSANNQEDDADYANRKGFSKHHPALPLYSARDVHQALPRLKAVDRGQWFHACGPFWCRLHDAGHLLGSAMVEVEVRNGKRPTRIVFSGDVGRYGAPIYHDPTPPPQCDYLICEGTYGNREHPQENVLDQLCGVVQRSIERGGVMLVASFAVGRAQQLIYLLQVLIQQGRIPELPVYLDSPMSVDATNIFASHAEDHDLSEGRIAGNRGAVGGKNVRLARTVAESKRINAEEGPAVIIASSGMMTGGRILHHLKRRLPDPQNTIVLGGFMAAGTRGRALQEGADRLRIHGADVPVRAHIEAVSALSGHAGRSELLRWLGALEPPRQVFLTHGEPEGLAALAAELHQARGWNTCVPRLHQEFELEETS